MNKNNHITKYLKYYCNKVNAPRFAVLIKGEWGSGKTWFINDFINKYGPNNFLYISLYGLNDTKEIDELIFEKIHPLLSSKPVVLVSKIAKSALKLGLKFDLSSGLDSSLDVEGQIPNLSITDFTKRLTSKILVFDDLERNSIKPDRLLGYFNTFIEHHSIKIILIGDETKFIKLRKINYFDVKEKIVGHTFSVLPEPIKALDLFISELQDRSCKSLMRQMKFEIIELFNDVGYNNLRDLRQALLNFEYLYINISNEFKKENYYFKKLLLSFCYLTLELKANQISLNTWNHALEVFFYNKTSQKQYKELAINEQNEMAKKAMLSTINRFNVPLGNLLFQVIFNGIIEENEINSSIKSSKEFSENKTTLWRLLRNFRNLSPEHFQSEYVTLITELKNNKYKHPGDILHAAGLLLLFSKWRIIPLKQKEITEYIISIIVNLNESGILEDFVPYTFPTDFGGIGFAERETDHFKSIWFFLKDQITSQRLLLLKNEVINMLELFPERFKDFCRELNLVNVEGKFSHDPVLAWINPEVFLNKFVTVPNDDKAYFIYALKDRYKLKYSNGKLDDIFYEEEDFIKTLKLLIMSKLSQEHYLYNTTNVTLDGIAEELNPILLWFTKQKENK